MNIYALLWSKTWPVLLLVGAFVGCIYFMKFMVKRWKAL
jgi:hypothetical protein